MNRTVWWVLGGLGVAFVYFRARQWRLQDYPQKPWSECVRLGLLHPLSSPPSLAAKTVQTKVTTASAGDGTGKSGPTIVSIANSKKTGVSTDGGKTYRTL